MIPSLAQIRATLHRLRADRRGNVMVMTVAAMFVMTFAVGFGVDYSRAQRLQTRLNAAADAAALAAVDPSMILQSDATAQAAAQAMFTAQAASLSGVTNLQPTVTITDGSNGTNSALGTLRKVVVAYTASSTNAFGGILRVTTLPISGSATASAQQPPNVNFYLAMDVSPSMLLPATSSGLTAEANATAANVNSPNGCDFACHEMIPHNDHIYINDTSGRQVLLSSGYYGTGSTANTYYLYDTSTSTLYNSSGTAMNTSSSSSTTGATTTSGSTSSTPTTVTTTAQTYSITDSTSTAVTITLTTTTTTTVTTTTTKTTTKNGKKTTTTSTSTSSPTTSSTSSTYDKGYWADGYWLTHNYGLIYGSPSSLTLRVDDEIDAAQQLIPYAANQASSYHVTYQMQMFSFDWTHSGATMGPVKQLSSMTDVSKMGSVNVASLMPATDYWWQNSWPTSAASINDQGTEMGNMLTQMKTVMPVPGTGASNSTPQEILFIVTDGMADEYESGRVSAPLTTADLAVCNAIKTKGIKIAILYTQYLPQALVGDSWSQTNVAPYLPAPPYPYAAGNSGSSDQVLTALQSCASTGASGNPLVQTVTTDGDFTAALQQLFSTALQSARLVQ